MAIAATMAHRTTGTAPCFVHFSSVNRNLAVRASSNITGVTFGDARNLTAAGTGVVAFTASGQTISYTAPGDSAGTPLALTANLQSVKLYSANGVDWIYIDVTYASLPVGNQSDNITITSIHATGVQQPMAVLDPGDPDYASQAYFWDFGDQHSIDYTLTNSHNSNNCWGAPQSAHLFTEPGTYNVRLYVWDVNGVVTTYYETIAIARQEDTATVYYVDATGGSNANAGTNPAAPLQTFAAAVAKITGDNIMLKFKRGETFPVSANVTISRNQITFTSYYNADGSDDPTKARPHLTIATTSGEVFASGSGIQDLKLCHLRATGPGSGSGIFCDPGSIATPTQNALIYDCYITALHTGITINGTDVNWGTKGLGIVHTEINDVGFGSGGNGIFVELRYGAILGTRVYDTTGGEHCVRVYGFNDAVIADSHFEHPDNTKSALTVRGTDYGAVNATTGLRFTSNSYLALLRNKTIATGTGHIVLHIAPTTNLLDERLEHVIIDSHVSTSGTSNTSNALGITGRDYCFRNTILRSSAGLWNASSSGTRTCPRQEWIRVFNCVGITDGTGSSAVFLLMTGVDSSTANDTKHVQLKNNIWYKAGSATHNYLWFNTFNDIGDLLSDYNLAETGTTRWSSNQPDSGSATTRTLAQTQSDLSRDTNSLQGTAAFTDAANGNYTLQASSSAIGLGDDTLLPWVRFDAAGNLRGSDIDAGAYEYGASPLPRNVFRVVGSRLCIKELVQ